MNYSINPMETPTRNKEIERFITLRGNPSLLTQAYLHLGIVGAYGIKFKPTTSLGDDLIVLDLNTDTMYWTEEGRLVGEYRVFTYPSENNELLKELCNESQRRFEALSGD